MRLTQSPLVISILTHLLLLAVIFFISYRTSITYNEPIDIIDLIGHTASLNSVPEAKMKSKGPAQKSKPILSSSKGLDAATPVIVNSASSPDSNYSGPVSEDYEVGEMPILLNEVKASYPPEVKAKGIQGNVVFDLIVDQDGNVAQLTLISTPDSALTAAAETAIQKFKFKPARISDKPVAIKIRYSYRFLLQ